MVICSFESQLSQMTIGTQLSSVDIRFFLYVGAEVGSYKFNGDVGAMLCHRLGTRADTEVCHTQVTGIVFRIKHRNKIPVS